jgi:hypothetical protein
MARKRQAKTAKDSPDARKWGLIDPRFGDIENDASSTKRRSMLSLAGSLLVEISLPKLIVAWILLLVVPGLLLGLAPIVVSSWLSTVTNKLASMVIGIWSLLALASIIAIGWFGWRALLRTAEKNFWALTSIVVQPGYAAFREVIRHVAENLFAKKASNATRAKLRAASAAVAGILICGLASLLVTIVWPRAYLFANVAEIDTWRELAVVSLANSVVAIAAYLAIAALIWGFADALMPRTRDITAFAPWSSTARTWRIAHLSDIHVVGERYGFRIESGRSGPRGNGRLRRLLVQLEAIHAQKPLHAVLITGDVTDAGISSEWGEFLEAAGNHPRLAKRMLMLPGNHDLNIVDRANPARLDLPTSPNRRLRQVRILSAMNAIQGRRVRVVDLSEDRLGGTLEATLAAHRRELERFADAAKPALSTAIPELWARVFPMISPPDKDDGIGIILLNSNADTHFSFTNALGMVSAEQMRAVDIACATYPRACWVIALHHHVMEYPRAAKTLSERIGTALINGNWFVRSLQKLAGRAILMHGHRHIDWIGECAGLPIVSAPSPVMEVTNERDTAFYIHTLAIGSDGKLKLLRPERIVVRGDPTPKGKRRSDK